MLSSFLAVAKFGTRKGLLVYGDAFLRHSVQKTGFWCTEWKFGTGNPLLRYATVCMFRMPRTAMVQYMTMLLYVYGKLQPKVSLKESLQLLDDSLLFLLPVAASTEA